MHDVAETPDTIRDFWFGWEIDENEIARSKSELWWSKNESSDRLIRKRFGSCVMAAIRGRLNQWADTAEGHLALILLTDQMPRNIYRQSRKAFAFDEHARIWCKTGLKKGLDGQLRPIERVFFYMPLEHSENLDDQGASVRLFEKLVREAPENLRSLYARYLEYAEKHRDIVARFGRFPHRNMVLGRRSTSEEIEFLRQPGSSF